MKENLFEKNPLAMIAWGIFAETGSVAAYRLYAELKDYDVEKMLKETEEERVR